MMCNQLRIRFSVYAAASLLFAGSVLGETSAANDLWLKQESQTSLFALNMNAMASALASRREVLLPLPDGSLAEFTVAPSQLMAPELSAKFLDIKTYAGHALNDPSTAVQIDLTPKGFRAQIIGRGGTFYIDPVAEGLYRSAFARDWPHKQFRCGDTLTPPEPEYRLARLGNPGNALRTFRIAIAAQGEFTAFHGGTKEGAMSAIVTIMNRVNGIYEAELGIRFMIVPNNDQIIYTDASNDPYSANAFTEQILIENQRNTDAVIGSKNYDLGIVLNTSGEGLAYGKSVCLDGYKARSVVGAPEPTGDYFAVGFVAHEIAHQFGAYHTFNSLEGKCNGRRFPNSAFEPGSGSTLMSYGGICGKDDLQGQRDPYFHAGSLDEIMNFLRSGSAACASVTSTGNNPPSVNAGPDYAIPAGTPFVLTASGSDPDGDRVTFCWEQLDLGPPQSVYDGDNGSSPLFRSHIPTTNPSRTFPRMEDILQNRRIRGEQLPSMNRILNLRVTARDGRGAISHDDVRIQVVNTGARFSIIEPNAEGTWSGAQTVRWEVAQTTESPINVSRVNIMLSTDGGNTFPITLAANTPNDGAETIVLPSIITSSARIKIEAVGNIFFDVSDGAFHIVPNENPQSFPSNSGSKWAVAGVNDFNSDGQPDLLFRHINGAYAVQFQNGTTPVGSILLRDGHRVSAAWRLVTLHDFNNDGSRDLLWQHADGRLAVWLLNGSLYTGAIWLRNGRPPNTLWRAVGVGDFTANGSGDILFRHSDGRIALWEFSGTNFIRAALVRNGRPVGAAWKIVSIGDFNADNQADILLRHTKGNLAVWLMNDAEPVSSRALRSGLIISQKWRVVSVADFNLDGSSDILWRHTDNRVAVWLMDETNFIRALRIPE